MSSTTAEITVEHEDLECCQDSASLYVATCAVVSTGALLVLAHFRGSQPIGDAVMITV